MKAIVGLMLSVLLALPSFAANEVLTVKAELFPLILTALRATDCSGQMTMPGHIRFDKIFFAYNGEGVFEAQSMTLKIKGPELLKGQYEYVYKSADLAKIITIEPVVSGQVAESKCAPPFGGILFQQAKEYGTLDAVLEIEGVEYIPGGYVNNIRGSLDLKLQYQNF